MMKRNWILNAGKRTLILLLAGVFSVLLSSSIALAQAPDPPTLDPDDMRFTPASTEAVADPAYEVGTEWIAYFTQCPANDIPCEEPQCEGFYYALRDAGWTGKFNYGNCSAWAKDFQRSAIGGSENSIVDSADIVLFCDHGGYPSWDSFWNTGLSYIHFGCDGPNDDCNVSPGEAYRSYGDNDLEWMAFKACSVFGGGPGPYYNRGYWASTMNGLHLLLGFRNSSSCRTNFGEKWAKYMLGYRWCLFGNCFWLRPPYKITQAWFRAVDKAQPSGVCARVLAEVHDNYNDYLWGRGYVSPDPTPDGTYWYWDHCSGTPPPRQLSPDLLNQIETLPVYEVKDRVIDEAYVLEIAAAFGMSDTEVYSDTEYYYMIKNTGVDTYTLEVDKTSGGYAYENLSELWASPVETPTLLAEGEALRLGDQFYAGQGEELPGAAYHTGGATYMVEEQVEVQMPSLQASLQAGLQTRSPDGLLEEQELSRIPVNSSLSYARVIDVHVGLKTASGGRRVEQVQLSTVGPGAREKLYLGDLGKILGAQGGMRDIQTTGADVTVMTADKAWDLYLADPTIALDPIPWVYNVVSRTAETLGYYEHPQEQQQQELIPSWIFSATFTAEGEVIADGVAVYVPASTEYLPPIVSIQSPAEGAVFEAGQAVTFQGTVEERGTAPFTYAWQSSYSGPLGSGATLEAPLPAAILKSSLISHTITLQVTDANGQSGTASRMVYVRAALYLPLVIRDL